MMSEQIAINISRELYQRAERLAVLRRREVQEVIEQALDSAITIELSAEERGWQLLMESIEKYQVNTGITDLADQHDHYLYGKPKRDVTHV
jgi:predicted transcriptional regulator